MNICVLTGRLGNDPREIGKSVHFNMALDRKVKGEKQTLWIDCVCFGKQAETVMTYLKKGSSIGVTGSIWLDSFTDKNGMERQKLSLSVSSFDFLTGASRQDQPEAMQERRPAAPSEARQQSMMDELPF